MRPAAGSVGPQGGFSLIELAVVVAIVGLILGALLASLAPHHEARLRRQTEVQLEEIREAIIGYAMVNGRLPCPDCPDDIFGDCASIAIAERNDGREDRNSGTGACRTREGNLPWADLAVAEFDAWLRPWYYVADSDFSDIQNPAIPDVPSFTLDAPDAAMQICSSVDCPANTLVADNVPAIVLSTGPNWASNPVAGGYEEDNFDGDDNFVYRPYAAEQPAGGDPLGGFGHIVTWISPFVLRSRMVSAGQLP